ncbi:MAG: hypothetical protein DWI03_09625 [Planctomycetota bacterium]|nr:MAG: hypothetical protein DWI03_09625 [Planctomycetota bacterium]
MRFVLNLHRLTLSVAIAAAAGGLSAAIVREDAAEPVLRLDLPGHMAEVRALAFFPGSSRLVSGGRDKVAIVWNPGGQPPEKAVPGTRDIGRRRSLERVLRWQVARGTRGAIQALAVSAGKRPLVAVAGSGAMGSTGEIILLDAKDGGLAAVLGGGEKPGHRNSVLALAFSTDGEWLFSHDFDGACYAWKRDAGWRPVELAARESERYGPARTAAVQQLPRLRPLSAVGGGRAAVPLLVSPEGASPPLWRLEVVDPGVPRQRSMLPTDHRGLVTALGACADGRYLASADLGGVVHVHDLADKDPKPVSFKIESAAESIAVSPDGGTVVLGVAAAGGGKTPPRFEVWDVKAGRRTCVREMPASVRAVALSDDGTSVAWTGGWQHEVFVMPLRDLVAGQPVRGRMGGVGRRIGRIAFEKQEPGQTTPRRIAIAWERPPGGGQEPRDPRPTFDAIFDIEKLGVADPPAEERLAPPAGFAAAWRIARASAQPAGVEVWQLTHEGKPAGLIPLDLGWQGRMGSVERCVAWLTEIAADGQRANAGEPWGVAVGTDRGIFIYALAADRANQPLSIVRRYRGHEDGVTALAVSQEGRWLASGSRDGIVMLWPLPTGRAAALTERFGVGLEVQNGRAVVVAVDEAGPLAGRGVAVGDVLAKVSVRDEDDAARTEAAAGKAVVAALEAAPWGSQWAFVVERAGRAEEPFNRQPAWENIAAVHLADNREWAFWSPRGYYAASANGDALFGWLVNRGLERLPRFHAARHFRRTLERPDVMSRLLAAGSLAEALRQRKADESDASARLLPGLLAAAPEVRILSPEAFESADGESLLVRATVEIPPGSDLSDVRAYASGVVARGAGKVVAERAEAAGPTARTYEWQLDLPAENEHLVQVFAGTSAGVTDVEQTTITCRQSPPRRRPPRLHLLAAGVDHYLHAERFAGEGLTNLVYATKDAAAVRDSLAAHAIPFQGLSTDVLLRNGEVTRAGWQKQLAGVVDTIAADVTPDDLVVVFLAGHGMNAPGKQRGYAFLCHDASFEERGGELLPGASSTIGWEDLRPLAALPCRKLAIIDTCHAGALAPVKRGATARDLQENMVLVLSASADDESSQESDAWGHGAFTKVLLEALAGAADVGGGAAAVGGDGTVSLDEVVAHVLATVPKLTAAGLSAQHPTVAPDALVPYVTLPLTKH